MTSTLRLAALLALLLAGCAGLPLPVATDIPPGFPAALPPIGHVFVIVLENKGYQHSFGLRAHAKYLSRDLPAQGVLLRQYYAIGHESLDNYIAMISGQAPNYETQADCTLFGFSAFKLRRMHDDGQAEGHGCVYPKDVPNLADQIEASPAKLSWREYAEDLDNGSVHSCRHPPVGSKDPDRGSRRSSQYVTRHVPFVYFRSVIDDPARCDRHVVDLQLLTTDLQKVETTPSFSFITPDLCSDGHDGRGYSAQVACDLCADGRPSGYESVDAFLAEWVPRITAAPAFRKDGLLIVTFDEADDEGDESIEEESSASCCNQPLGYNTRIPGIHGPGGGRVGAVLVSPYIKPGTASDVPYNHYALLKSVEELYALKPLGYAGMPGLRSFGSDVYSCPQGTCLR
ncbi:MAG TPA: alkaline phosphatase family protein [Nevskiaceae bacterium]|nr:alkaline phosphatase family protein [Nevskiaceae bacterium]